MRVVARTTSLVLAFACRAAVRLRRTIRMRCKNQNAGACSNSRSPCSSGTGTASPGRRRSIATIRSWKRCWPRRGNRRKVVEDQLAAVRDQLSHRHGTQLAQVRDEKQLTEKQTEALMASTRRRAGAQITANNSLQSNLPAINLPRHRSARRRRRGAHRTPRVATLPAGLERAAAGGRFDCSTSVAAELARPIPIRRSASKDTPTTTSFALRSVGDHQQLSVARATAVYQYLVARGQIPANRMFIVGHGSNHPVVSNATAAGKARNNRVELVVYPEKAAASSR